MKLFFLAGDSTVAPAKPREAPLAGWGDYLGEYLGGADADHAGSSRGASPVFAVHNHAVGGATLLSFEAEGRWAKLLAGVADAGERAVVIIQFGHNDQKQPQTLAPHSGYAHKLRQFVGQVRELGGQPILATSVERRHFDGALLRPSHGPYPGVVRQVGRELAVPVIDLQAFSRWLYEQAGPEESKHYFTYAAPGQNPNWPDGVADNTHFSEYGAREIAKFVALSLRGILGFDDELEPFGQAIEAGLEQAGIEPAGLE